MRKSWRPGVSRSLWIVIGMCLLTQLSTGGEVDKGTFILRSPEGRLLPDGSTTGRDVHFTAFSVVMRELLLEDNPVLASLVAALDQRIREKKELDPTYEWKKPILDVEVGNAEAILAQIEREEGKLTREIQERLIHEARAAHAYIEGVTYDIETAEGLVVRVKLFMENFVTAEGAGGATAIFNQLQIALILIHEIHHALDLILELGGLSHLFATDGAHGGNWDAALEANFSAFRSAWLARLANEIIGHIKALDAENAEKVRGQLQEELATLRRRGFVAKDVVDLFTLVSQAFAADLAQPSFIVETIDAVLEPFRRMLEDKQKPKEPGDGGGR